MAKIKEFRKKMKKHQLLIITIITGVIIIGAWLFTYFILQDQKDRGSFGDMFGSINALFSGLALAGIILTILLQKQELGYQRAELRETREEFKQQNETLKIQRFESTFFNLLNIHHKIVSDIDIRFYKNKERESDFVIASLTQNDEKEIVILEGRDVFRYRFNRFLKDAKLNDKDLDEIYMNHYKEGQTDLGHYFRNLYRMLKMVDATDFFYNKEDVSGIDIFKIKYKYSSIIRSQISDFELGWLFYNCLSSNGKEKFKPLLEEYSFLKNLPDNLLIDLEHKKLYSSKAFKPII